MPTELVQTNTALERFTPYWASYRRGTDVYDHSDRGRCGRYWVSSAYDKFSTYGLHFDASFVNPNFDASRYIGSAVRLVREVNE